MDKYIGSDAHKASVTVAVQGPERQENPESTISF